MQSGSMGKLSPFKRIEHGCYCTLYQNVLNRVIAAKEQVNYDFFGVGHKSVEQYRKTPTAVECAGVGTYLVVGNKDRVVLLLPPEMALRKNLPYLAVFDGVFFRPHIGKAATYWQRYMEPEPVGAMQTY